MSLVPNNFFLKIILGGLFFIVVVLVIYFNTAPLRQSVVSKTSASSTMNIVNKNQVVADVASTTDKIPGLYTVYSESKIKKAEDVAVVLFFNASWCPLCQKTDKELTSTKIPDGVMILSVDYDSYVTLRKKYEVTYQHTFVLVDKDGLLIKKWSGGGLGSIIQHIKD